MTKIMQVKCHVATAPTRKMEKKGKFYVEDY
jgi:hypothetical protein